MTHTTYTKEFICQPCVVAGDFKNASTKFKNIILSNATSMEDRLMLRDYRNEMKVDWLTKASNGQITVYDLICIMNEKDFDMGKFLPCVDTSTKDIPDSDIVKIVLPLLEKFDSKSTNIDRLETIMKIIRRPFNNDVATYGFDILFTLSQICKDISTNSSLYSKMEQLLAEMLIDVYDTNRLVVSSIISPFRNVCWSQYCDSLSADNADVVKPLKLLIHRTNHYLKDHHKDFFLDSLSYSFNSNGDNIHEVISKSQYPFVLMVMNSNDTKLITSLVEFTVLNCSQKHHISKNKRTLLNAEEELSGNRLKKIFSVLGV